jgi:hypothetical protein
MQNNTSICVNRVSTLDTPRLTQKKDYAAAFIS